MKPLWVIVTGDPVPPAQRSRGDFFAMFQQAAGSAYEGPWAVVDAREPEAAERLPTRHEACAVIVTGSAARLGEQADWMLLVQRYLRETVDSGLPVLGVCFGHQLLGQALGGEVGANPNGREIGTVELSLLKRDELINEDHDPFQVNMTHVDSVLELPRGASVLARSPTEPHAAVRFTETAWGVQFHPEIDRHVLCHYVTARRTALVDEGHDPAALEAGAGDAPAGNEVLRRFVQRFAR